MIYLTAQPDEYYFLWQLQLQLFNFSKLGIKKENIHVLIAIKPERGLSSFFAKFISGNNQALFFIYSDSRIKREYLSSIRPHIIAKHYAAIPILEKETIFYLDSDVIFTHLPDLNSLIENDLWYASDTDYYTGFDYLRRFLTEEQIEKMISLCGVEYKVFNTLKVKAGGAQYILKNATIEFWKKMEINCEAVFSYLTNILDLDPCSQLEKLQLWCTDMWCFWWGSFAAGHKLETPKILDFGWANSPKTDNGNSFIIHYTGNISDKQKSFFRKNNYVYCSPFYDNFEQIDNSTLSETLVKEIHLYNKEKFKMRVQLLDVSFLIPVRIDSFERLENVYVLCSYLSLNLDTKIIILEASDRQQIDSKRLPANVKYIFMQDSNTRFHRTRYNNILITEAKTKYIVLQDTDVIIPVEQILESVHLLRSKNYDVVYPYNNDFLNVGLLLKVMFSKSLDTKLFSSNHGKLKMASRRSYGGCILLNKEKYRLAGMENENLDSWGPDDVERWKRLLILGFSIIRTNGVLYHLSHPRSLNSGYTSIKVQQKLLIEYFKISCFSKEELLNYIKTWNWVLIDNKAN